MNTSFSRDTLEHRRVAMRTDAALPFSRLDRDVFERHATVFRQRAIGLVNYVSYFNALQTERAKRRTQFLPEVKRMLLSRATFAVDDCHAMVESFAKIVDVLQVSGVSEVLERHLPQVLEAADPEAIHRKFAEYCSAVGLVEDQVAKPLHVLARTNYNLLAFGKGTIGGLVETQQKLLPFFTNLKNRGPGARDVSDDGPVYVINGGDGNGDGDGDVSNPGIIVIVILGVVIVGYIACIEYNAYHSTDPGFEPLDCEG